ncbi:MAG: DUF3857 domain-containing protein [Opitutaceae bacterium]|jgi:hypothetical protein|nr:DUF3857 domain-containing protein [Opitutaceae bacterium]
MFYKCSPLPFARARASAIVFAIALCLAPALRAAQLKLPPWLAEASLRQAQQTKETTAIMLHDECIYTVASNGRMTNTVRAAFRIVTGDGRSVAQIGIHYDSSSQKVTGFKAWLVRPGGEGKTYSSKDTVDVATSSEAVYAESRQIVFSAHGDAYEDCVFACEYTVEDRGAFGEHRWWFQSQHPVALSRLTCTAPKGWTISAEMRNHAPVDPVVNGNSYTWELRDLPAIKPEPLSPSYFRFAPRLSVDFAPPAGMKNPPLAYFSDWNSVSVYLTNLHAKPCLPDAAVTAKAQELLASAGPGLWDRINVLARHAQAVNYVQIAMNVGRGGGYTPRAAPDVLKTGYGDCKDKTALLRALLKAAGIESYSVVAYSGDRYHVTEEWPTPQQFNHAITAVKIDDPSIQSPAIVDHPRLGRLLFFDPTDYYTPLGDLDYDQQGSLVLVLAAENGGLVRLPFTPPMSNHLDRTVTAEIINTGAIGGRILENYTGQAAVHARAIYRSPKIKFADVIRDWINGTVRAARLIRTDVTDAQEQGRFDMTAEFVAPAYGQSMRGKLLIFKPAIVSRRDFIPLTQPDRLYPVVLEPQSYNEASDIKIPDGFKIDEMPPPVETETAFGRYTANCAYDEATHQVRYRRTLVMNAAEIPASDYATVRAFYETIRKAEQTPVVLSAHVSGASPKG